MAGSFNKVLLIGNVGQDPEVRQTKDGKKIVNFSLATSETWRDRETGERHDRTEWHRIVIFNEPLADIAERYLKKGAKVFVEGQLQTRKWTDQSGAQHHTTEVVLPRFRGELGLLSSRHGDGESGGGGSYHGGGGGGGNKPIIDDEMPF